MTAYRKKPVVVEAIQFVHGVSTKREMLEFCPDANIGTVNGELDTTDLRWFVIPTLEGNMNVSDFDYIIRGVQGEFYPCKPDIFAETYEAVAG